LNPNQFNNVYLDLGGSTILRSAGSGGSDYAIILENYGAGTRNFTLTSTNGTAYIDSNNKANCIYVNSFFNSTFSNIQFQHGYSVGVQQTRCRYNIWTNIVVFSYAETESAQGGFCNSDVQYSNFKNITVDGNNIQMSRVAFYIGDWDNGGPLNWNGSYFNKVSGLHTLNVWRTGIYLNAGSGGNDVYNNTFTNCTMENNVQSAYDAIKLRPAINNTFTDIVIRNFTDCVTTGTGMPPSEAYGNCTGNSITATIYDSKTTSFILTTDSDGESVDHNFFNLTMINSKGTWFSSGTDSPIHDNICYLTFINCSSAIYLEQGIFHDNTFYLKSSNSYSLGLPDIWHYASLWANIVNNTFNIYSSDNPYGIADFASGTQGNIIVYPYTNP
jgi:hypothetical protein